MFDIPAYLFWNCFYLSKSPCRCLKKIKKILLVSLHNFRSIIETGKTIHESWFSLNTVTVYRKLLRYWAPMNLWWNACRLLGKEAKTPAVTTRHLQKGCLKKNKLRFDSNLKNVKAIIATNFMIIQNLADASLRICSCVMVSFVAISKVFKLKTTLNFSVCRFWHVSEKVRTTRWYRHLLERKGWILEKWTSLFVLTPQTLQSGWCNVWEGQVAKETEKLSSWLEREKKNRYIIEIF